MITQQCQTTKTTTTKQNGSTKVCVTHLRLRNKTTTKKKMNKFYVTRLEKVTDDDQDDDCDDRRISKSREGNTVKRILLIVGSICVISATAVAGIVFLTGESNKDLDENLERLHAVAPADRLSERRETRVCQEVYGMQYCGEAQSLDTCHSSCIKTVRNHLNVNYVCQSNDDPDKSIMAYVQNDAEHWTRDVPEPTSRFDILKRGVTWLKSRVRYSQRRYHSETVADGKKYRPTVRDICRWHGAYLRSVQRLGCVL